MTDRQTDRQTDRPDRQTDRQTDRQARPTDDTSPYAAPPAHPKHGGSVPDRTDRILHTLQRGLQFCAEDKCSLRRALDDDGARALRLTSASVV